MTPARRRKLAASRPAEAKPEVMKAVVLELSRTDSEGGRFMAFTETRRAFGETPESALEALRCD